MTKKTLAVRMQLGRQLALTLALSPRRGNSCPSSAERSRRRAGFTLIELLVVIAVIALLAAMIMPITGAVSRNKIRSRARVEMARIQAAIDSYKAKLGTYPPDTSPNPPFPPILNQLYYELAGTVATPANKATSYTTLDGSSTITPALVPNWNVQGFINSNAKGASGDEARPAENFLPGLKPDQTVLIYPNGKNSPTSLKILVGYPWKKLSSSAEPRFTVDPLAPLPGTEGLNPWRYRCHTDKNHPTLNNPDSYDLWLDVNIGGTVYRISNWSPLPQKVTTSLDY